MTFKDLSYLYPSYPIIGSISLVLCMIPVPIHWKVGNIAIVSLALWTSIGLLMTVIDTCIWHGNIRNPYPIWGDIVQAYFAVLSTALAACTLCIQYRLWSIARAKSVFMTKREKRRERYATYFWCYGVAVIVGLLHYVVQGHRYNVWEDLGPTSTTYNVTLSFPLYWIWEPLICFVSGLLAIHTIALFLARRKELNIVLNSGAANINKDRYVRLMALAATAAFIHLPLASWIIIIYATVYPVYPWISWEDTHSNYHHIQYVNRFLIATWTNDALYMSIALWSLPLCGINFFLFFGFGEEATKQYRYWLRTCLQLFGIEYPKEKSRRSQKTWKDILLCRPGRPINTDTLSPNRVIPGFAIDTFETRSTDRHTTSIQSQPGTNPSSDINAGVLITELGGSSANLQHGSLLTQMQHNPPQDELPVHERSSMDIADSKNLSIGDTECQSSSSSSPPSLLNMKKVEVDLEAHKPSELTVEQQRRIEILAQNPELTEEISF